MKAKKNSYQKTTFKPEGRVGKLIIKLNRIDLQQQQGGHLDFICSAENPAVRACSFFIALSLIKVNLCRLSTRSCKHQTGVLMREHAAADVLLLLHLIHSEPS